MIKAIAIVNIDRPSRLKRQNIRTLSLVVITLTYLIIGAAVFDYVESVHEEEVFERLNRNISDFKGKHNMTDNEFNHLWNIILEKKPHHAGNQWKFMGSLYFCTVVVALIGYGHSTPKTMAGKFFCVFYALIGVPIALIMFQSVGERLNSLIAFILAKIKQRLRLKNQDIGLVELITVEAALTLTITFVASYVFTRNEGWSYFDSMYYCFITLTTIGFGDIVPMQKNNALTSNFPYACFTIMFILTGLITLASSMNLLVLRLATINAEEQVQEKLEAAERVRQAVHLEGDVINPRTQLFVTQAQEKPEQIDTISVCSCACLDYKLSKSFSSRRKSRAPHSSSNNDNSTGGRFTNIFRRSQQVKRLFGDGSGQKRKKSEHQMVMRTLSSSRGANKTDTTTHGTSAAVSSADPMMNHQATTTNNNNNDYDTIATLENSKRNSI